MGHRNPFQPAQRRSWRQKHLKLRLVREGRHHHVRQPVHLKAKKDLVHVPSLPSALSAGRNHRKVSFQKPLEVLPMTKPITMMKSAVVLLLAAKTHLRVLSLANTNGNPPRKRPQSDPGTKSIWFYVMEN